MRALVRSIRSGALCLMVGLIVLPAAAAPTDRDGTHNDQRLEWSVRLERIYQDVVATWSRLLYGSSSQADSPAENGENPPENEADRGPMIDPDG